MMTYAEGLYRRRHKKQAMKSDAQKTYERNSQPVIEEKNRAIGKTYMSNFLLRKALSMANTAVSSDEVASNE